MQDQFQSGMVRYTNIEITVIKEEVFSHSSLEMRGGTTLHGTTRGSSRGGQQAVGAKRIEARAFIVASVGRNRHGRAGRFRIGWLEWCWWALGPGAGL